MVVLTAQGSGRFEKMGSYSRAKRVGPFVYIAGTTSMHNGELQSPFDIYAQSIFIFDQIEKALGAVGAEMRHVVRTKAYVTDMRDAGGFIKAHGELFKDIEPVLTGVQAGLTTPGMMVEIEVDAIIHDENGKIDYGQ
ncbi:MAG: RidA family protein [Alphaproteobacteria bacterium]|jgi:enamine deaminase RidA (YjgF/YER057c/UK114 family)|nr:RidA family protein [Alphaproteobacteria bacterium]MBT4020290.1 RidA family protein [Alphaproteobacteria bacterium]MBT7744568.1 RidA family protein [Alphaproteobacteria bacterium]